MVILVVQLPSENTFLDLHPIGCRSGNMAIASLAQCVKATTYGPISMNTSKPYKQRILDLSDVVGAEGTDNARIRKETGIPSHQQVYLLTQELTKRREITARREAGSGFSTR